MKNITTVINFILCSLQSFTYALAPSANVAAVDRATSNSSFDLLKDWRAISLAVTMLVIVIIAIAYAVGHGFEIPELKAWAATELAQAVATILVLLHL